MNKGFHLERNLNAYKSFLDHEWAQEIDNQTSGTPLEEIFFDLQWSWKGAANTFFMPWLTISTMVRAGLSAAADSGFTFRFVAGLETNLEKTLGLTNMKNKLLRRRLKEISDHVNAVENRPPLIEEEAAWQKMLGKPEDNTTSEFRLSIWGSQRLAYGAVYYAYEDFLARCYRVTAGKDEDYDVELSKQFGSHYGEPLLKACWTDPGVNIARLTRHALVHNGGRLTKRLKKEPNHGHMLIGDDIQIHPAVTKRMYALLKDRVTTFLNHQDGPLARLKLC